MYQTPISDVVKHKVYPTPKGRSDVIVNLLFDQDISCKNVSYELVARYGATAGIKRKRAEATGDADDELQEQTSEKESRAEKE